MLRRRFKMDSEHIRVDMSWRLATSLAIGLVTGAGGAVTWAYAYGRDLVATADAHRAAALVAYPTWQQVLQAIREERLVMDQANQLRHEEVIKRLEHIEERLMRR